MKLGIRPSSPHLLPFLFALVLTVGSASAATEKILHAFSAHPRGWEPNGELIADTNGNFYGTTYYGGTQENGTVFKLTPTSSDGWAESVLYSFKGGSDGQNPMVGVSFDQSGNLYGTTSAGGASGKGAVFQLRPGANGTWTEKVIYSFTGAADGQNPLSGITVVNGNLYGTSGPLFELSPGTTGWTFSIVYTFEGGTDGIYPSGSLVFDKAGNIYGTTQRGGDPTGNYGTVYELSPLSGGGWTEKILYTFQGGADGGQPVTGVVLDNAGNLYGTTPIGGNTACPPGCGTVFEVSSNGDGTWAETVLHSFSGGRDGAGPAGGLIFDTAGNLYGTASSGGANSSCSSSAGCGIVFELQPGAGGQWAEHILASFASTGSGMFGTKGPSLDATPIFDLAGNLYGTTALGGTASSGTVFKLTPGSGGRWKKVYAYVFGIPDGSGPNAVVFDASGNLYGTTQSGGTYGYGAVFELKPNSNGGWTRSLLYSFKGTTDGASPLGPLVFDTSGNLYGTTNNGGNGACNLGAGCGVVFKLTPSSKGEWSQSVLHAFSGSDGFQPFGGVIFDVAGNLYGTTFYGGSNWPSLGGGTVFELSPSGGTWTETVIHSFGASSSDGTYPEAGLAIDSAGNLYGTTETGGSNYFGTVFKLAPGSNGQWTETILHAFPATSTDGYYLFGGVVLDAAGNVYGTTSSGGSAGSGTVFELAAGAGGQWTATILRDFSSSGNDGYGPLNAPTLDGAGNLYGVTSWGANGACSGYGCGAIFKLSRGSGGQWSEIVLDTFLGSPTDGDGGGPVILDQADNLYGPSGGGRAGDGVIFEVIQ